MQKVATKEQSKNGTVAQLECQRFLFTFYMPFQKPLFLKEPVRPMLTKKKTFQSNHHGKNEKQKVYILAWQMIHEESNKSAKLIFKVDTKERIYQYITMSQKQETRPGKLFPALFSVHM